MWVRIERKNTRKLCSSGLIGPLSDPDLTVTIGCHSLLSSLECMAGTTGLEPATSAVTAQLSANTCGIERRKPALHNRNGEAQAHWRPGSGRNKQAQVEELRKHHARHTFLIAGDGRRLAAFELTCQKSFTQQGKAAPWQASSAHLVFGVNLHPAQQFCWLQDRTHIFDLVYAGTQKELAELNQCFKREVSTTVKIVAPRSICGHEESFITTNIAGQSTRHRP